MWMVTSRPPMSAVHWSNGTGQISAASSNASVSGGSSRPAGCSAGSRRASRAMCPVSAETSGAVWVSSAPSMNTVPRSAEQPGDVEVARRRRPRRRWGRSASPAPA